MDLVPQVIYWIQIRTDGRPWHGSDVVLLEKVSGGSGSVGAGNGAGDGQNRVQCEVEELD